MVSMCMHFTASIHGNQEGGNSKGSNQGNRRPTLRPPICSTRFPIGSQCRSVRECAWPVAMKTGTVRRRPIREA